MAVDGLEGKLSLEPGEVIGGKYLVERLIGRGGMGVVFQARHLLLEERVALKVVAPVEGARHAASVSRLLREARAASSLRSPRTVRVRDVDRLTDGTPYIVMEHLVGSDLAAVLSTEGRQPVERAVRWVLDACEALAEAHARGIVHRDIKPSNLFLESRPGEEPRLKVLDFGIAKTLEPDRTAALTASDRILGSPLYVSPEQVRSAKDIGPATDVWSLGVVLYELVAGSTPFRGETTSALLAAVVADDPTPLRVVAADVPPEVEAVVLRCLEKERGRRWADVGGLAAALAPLVADGAERLGRVIAAARATVASGAGADATDSAERADGTVDPIEPPEPAPGARSPRTKGDEPEKRGVSTTSNWFLRAADPSEVRRARATVRRYGALSLGLLSGLALLVVRTWSPSAGPVEPPSSHDAHASRERAVTVAGVAEQLPAALSGQTTLPPTAPAVAMASSTSARIRSRGRAPGRASMSSSGVATSAPPASVEVTGASSSRRPPPPPRGSDISFDPTVETRL